MSAVMQEPKERDYLQQIQIYIELLKELADGVKSKQLVMDFDHLLTTPPQQHNNNYGEDFGKSLFKLEIGFANLMNEMYGQTATTRLLNSLSKVLNQVQT